MLNSVIVDKFNNNFYYFNNNSYFQKLLTAVASPQEMYRPSFTSLNAKHSWKMSSLYAYNYFQCIFSFSSSIGIKDALKSIKIIDDVLQNAHASVTRGILLSKKKSPTMTFYLIFISHTMKFVSFWWIRGKKTSQPLVLVKMIKTIAWTIEFSVIVF